MTTTTSRRDRRRRDSGHWIVGHLQGWAALREAAAFMALILSLLLLNLMFIFPDHAAAILMNAAGAVVEFLGGSLR